MLPGESPDDFGGHLSEDDSLPREARRHDARLLEEGWLEKAGVPVPASAGGGSLPAESFGGHGPKARLARGDRIG
jgi:hypothetical protein